MKYRQMGKSDLQASCIGLGGNIFGYFCDKKATKIIMDKASFLGINYVDTADVYSEGLSEMYIGEATHRHRSKWIIATKIGVRGTEPPHGRGKKEYIFSAVEQSLARLKTDYIDIYQIHHADPDTPLEETFSALEQLVREGKIRYFGVSNFTTSQLGQAHKTLASLGIATCISTQMHYNLLKRYSEPEILPLCQSFLWGVIVFGGVGRGVLSGKYHSRTVIPKNWRAAVSQSVRNDLTGDVIQTVEKLTDFAHGYGKSTTQLALAWLLTKREVTTIIVGTRNTKQLVENSLSADWQLGKKDLLEIDRIIGDLARFDSLSLGSFPLPYLGP